MKHSREKGMMRKGSGEGSKGRIPGDRLVTGIRHFPLRGGHWLSGVDMTYTVGLGVNKKWCKKKLQARGEQKGQIRR